MKTPMVISMICALVCFLGLFAFACSSTGSEFNEPELVELRFTRSTYLADQPLVLRATPNPDLDREILSKNPLTIQLTSSAGASTTEQLSPWSDLTDKEMVEAIKDGPGRAILRIKEAGQESTRNSQGELIRSEKAMNHFIEWVEIHDKLLISWVSKLHPNIVIEFSESPTENMVKEIRSHENVEFMEPDQYGQYLSATSEQAMTDDFVAIIFPEHSFTYTAGKTVNAVFQQVDGTILEASVTITK